MFTTSVQYLYELGLGNSLAMHFGNLTCDSKHLVFTLFLTEVNSSFHNKIILFRPPSDPCQTPSLPLQPLTLVVVNALTTSHQI